MAANSSSLHHNCRMESTDPLASFLIQHISLPDDPFKGWGLNCRSAESMETILKAVGFSHINIYSDTTYPQKEDLPEEVLYGIDTLPAEVVKYDHPGKPLSLPPREVLDRNTAYN